MDHDRNIEAAAERIVQWAAQHPLSIEEAESRYAHLLAGLDPIASRREWAVFSLGRLAVRYWREKVEAFQQSLGDGAFALAVGARGAGAPPAAAAAAPERTLRAEGGSGTAWAKIAANPDDATVALTLWLEPKAGGAPAPFTVSVLDAAQAPIAGPIACAAANVIRFAAIAAAEDYTLVFEAGAERWSIRWGFSPEAGAPRRESPSR